MRNGSLAWADFDNDGDLDLFVCGDVSGPIASSFSRVYRNHAGNLADTGILLPAYRSSSADWADFDNDGFVDLVLTGLSDYDVAGTRVFRNLGGTNLAVVALLPGVYGGRAAWGDFNQDGKADIAITGVSFGTSAGLTRVYVNNGGTDFTQFAILSPEFYYGTVDWADYDHDSDLDLLVTGEIGDLRFGAHIYQNNGNNFSAAGQIVVASGTSGGWFEANNDGWPDLLILAHSQANSFVRLNNHPSGFIAGGELGMLGSHAVGDANNDGFSDLLIAGYRYSSTAGNFVYDRSSLFLNTGTGTWLERTNLTPGLTAASAAWADYDNDGRLDLVLHGQRDFNYYSYLYRNVTPRTNQPPEPPTGLRAERQGNVVVLSWNPAADVEQLGGLTYNVRVGSAPGRSDVVSPLSAADGWRRVVKRGNADGLTAFTLRGLQTRRTYYWSVQAIDNAFRGSAFATEGTLTINAAPIASNLTVVLEEDVSQPITLTGNDSDGDALTFTLLTGPTNGVLTGTAPNLVYTPATNANGLDAFSFKANDGLTDSAPAAVRLTIQPVNDPPIADASATHAHWLSGNGTNVTAVLDGSRSSDVDGDELNYTWFSDRTLNPLATGVVALVRLRVGTNLIDLVVSDGLASDTNRTSVEVITPLQAIERLIRVAEDGVARPQPLLAILSAAVASIAHGNPIPAINKLQAFQRQARAQVAPVDSVLANQLIAGAQDVIDALSATFTPRNGRTVQLKLTGRPDQAKPWMEFEATAGHNYLVEASTDLVEWQVVGVAVKGANGRFQFKDPGSARFQTRFYRVVSP